MVKQQGIDNSKINQSELKYSCSAGEVSVNLFNDRVLFEHSDISIGANNYKIAVSHIYNSLFDEKISLKYGDGIDDYFKTGMGKGFKLNVQQYLIKDTDGSEYIYTDGVGYRHIFKELGNVRYSWGISRILNQNSVNSEFVKGRPKTSRSFFTFFIFTTAQTFLQDRICLATSKSRKFQSFFIAKKFYCFSDSWDSDILANIVFVIRYQNKFA